MASAESERPRSTTSGAAKKRARRAAAGAEAEADEGEGAPPPRKRAMATKDGQALSIEYLSRAQHNPGRKKKQREFYRKAQLIRKYRKLVASEARSASADAGGEGQRVADADDAADETRPRGRRREGKPRKAAKPLPFRKEFLEARRAKEEREAKRAAAESERAAARERRDQKRALVTKRTKKGQPVVRHRMQALLSKIEKQVLGT